MGTIQIFLCVFVRHFISAQSLIYEQDAAFPQDIPGFFENVMPFPFKRHFDFTPYDTIFSSWRTRTPDFHMLTEFPPVMNVPRVKVFCDESKLSLLVDKRSNGVVLTEEEMQLGDGCYSNRELPNQFVFTYGLDECGTTRVMQKGLEVFTNSLHLNLKHPPPSWWRTPSTVQISCIPRRSFANPNLVPTALPDSGETFNIKVMNSSWTNTAESNIYKRGQAVNLQVSAKIRPEQELFIQSCFVSASPDPQSRPRHAIIMNKGCVAPLASPHALVQFMASGRADVVNFVLNTSYLISELYVHCSVLRSDQGVTFGSKSCNYNVIQSRWEDLSRTTEVCECCSTKCRGLSVKHFSEDTKAIVSTGRLVIVDQKSSTEPSSSEPQTSTIPATDSTQSDSSAAADDTIVSGSSISRSELSSPPQGVVIVSRDPVTRLTLWLPGQVQGAENIGSGSEDNWAFELQADDMVSNDLPEQQLPPEDPEPPLKTPTKKIGGHSLNVLTLVDLMIPPQVEKAATAEDSQMHMRLGRFGLFGTESPQEADHLLPDEVTLDVLNQNGFKQMRGELAQRQADAAVMNNAGPVIRSKLQFSKGLDGSETLSYEEEAVEPQDGEGVIRNCGTDRMKRKEEPGQKLRSTFLDLLRRMDRAE